MTSIIIPTLNAEKQLPGLLDALRSQTIQGEIIVIDSSSLDRTLQIAESFGARTMTIRREHFDHGGSRTLAAKKAEGDILVYLTQDAVPSNANAVENLVKPFEKGNVGAAYGRQLPAPDASVFGAHSRIYNYPEQSCRKTLGDKEKYGIKTPFLSNAFAAYRKKTLKEIGWFAEHLISTEDTYAGARMLLAGYTLAYVSDAMVYHSHNYTVFQEFKRYFDIGVFHKKERWILEAFGNAEGTGLRFVSSEIRFLLKNRTYHLLPELVIRNCLKYAGFFNSSVIEP
jgi:rhamnosyltransferase